MWVCGGQIVTGTGLYVGVWWRDCYRDRFICGRVVDRLLQGEVHMWACGGQIVTGTGLYVGVGVDRLLQGQVYMWVCGGQIVTGTDLYVGVWWTDCYRDRFIHGCVVDRLLQGQFSLTRTCIFLSVSYQTSPHSQFTHNLFCTI